MPGPPPPTGRARALFFKSRAVGKIPPHECVLRYGGGYEPRISHVAERREGGGDEPSLSSLGNMSTLDRRGKIDERRIEHQS